MSIRNQIRRALHKSASSADSSATTSTTASSNNSQSSDTPLSSIKSSSSILSRAFTWSGREKDAEPKKEKKTRSKKRYTHPSEKPLTAQNLKHQEMFSHFTMTFGASDPSQIHRLSFDGISPCCTRRPSLECDPFASELSSQNYHSADEDSMIAP
ncbi:hypothetical protein B0I35DRAFT_40424 [Stachybotrys elegans]|uniref:Uncharacterized protein n=1 Tax=Stachybotrys elegans TaxID=80388 RepID=A0A8K0T2Z3_9HYPO|nr:hypothetical protein B0I35DRAFT_40424 [Stachybotrys elegans]